LPARLVAVGRTNLSTREGSGLIPTVALCNRGGGHQAVNPCPHNQRYHVTVHSPETVRVVESTTTSVTVTGTILPADLFGGKGCSSKVPLYSGGYITIRIQYGV
jgi:hypothetical protein